MDCSNASYSHVYSYFDSLPTFDIFYPRSKLFRKVSKTSYSIDQLFQLINGLVDDSLLKLIQVFMNTEWPGYTKVFLVNLAIVAVGCSCAMFYDKVRIWNLSIVYRTVKIGDIIRYAGSFCAMIYMFFLPCGVKVSCKKYFVC